jgi:kinetochore protein Spc7/SPC105
LQPPISIEQFLTLTEVNFLSEMTLPRRSLYPAQARRRDSLAADEVPLAEFFTGHAVHAPQLQLYTHAARDIAQWIAHSKENLAQAEAEAARVPPSLFREFVDADEDVKEELLHQLRLIRANCREHAKGQWYDWRTQWTDSLLETANEAFGQLTQACTLSPFASAFLAAAALTQAASM